MTSLLFAKISMVLTVAFAGWNARELMDSFPQLSSRVKELKDMLSQEEEEPELNPLGLGVYLLLPLLYLLLLHKASMHQTALWVVGFKLALTAGLNFWVARAVFGPGGFTRLHYRLGRLDNVANLVFAVAVVLLLLLPAG